MLCLVLFPSAGLGFGYSLHHHVPQNARDRRPAEKAEINFDLIADKPVHQTIAPRLVQRYRIALTAGQFLQAFLETQDAHLSLILLDPEQHIICEVNRRRFKPTPLSLIAERSGGYILEVLSKEVEGDAAPYNLTIKATRPAVSSDREVVAAERSFAAATRLREEWTAEGLRKAISQYEVTYNSWHRVGNQTELIETLTNIGEVYSTLSQNQKALDYYDQALQLSRAIGDRRSEADLLNFIGEINIDLGNRQMTLDYCQQALAQSMDTGYIRGQAQALTNRGLVYYVLSDMSKALDSLNQAMSLWKKAGDRRGQAQTLTDLAYAYNDLGNLHKALATLNEALVLWQKSKDLRGEMLTLTIIGLLHGSLGDMQKALDAHEKASQFFRKMGDQTDEAVTLNARAYIYDMLGIKEKALNYYQQAAQLYSAAGRRSSEAVTLGLIGEIYNSLGNKPQALEYYKQSLAISQQLGDRRAEAYALKDLGDAFVSLGEQDTALDHFNRALSLSESLSDPRGQSSALDSIGYVYEISGQKLKALDYYTRALALNRATEDRAGEVQTLHHLASVARDMEDFKEADKQSKALLSIVETLRTRIASQDLRASYFASVHQHYELAIDILMQLHKQYPTAGYSAAALEASERSRGRVLLDLLNEARADIRQGGDPALLQQERDLQQALNAKAERQVSLLSNEHTEQQATAIRKEVADLSGRYEAVLTQIRATSQRYATLTQPSALGLVEIQRQLLDADTLILEYALGDQRSYLWAISSTSTESFELADRSKIETAAVRLYRSLTAYSEQPDGQAPQQRRNALAEADSQYAQAAMALTQMLLAPLANRLGTKRLIIVADGVLQYVSFAALLEPDDLLSGKQERQLLVVNHEIVYVPSASILSALRSEIDGRSPATKALAVFADPVFEKDDPRVNWRGRNHHKAIGHPSAQDDTNRNKKRLRSYDLAENLKVKLRFQRLPFASSEAKAIASLLPEGERKLALGFDATLAMAQSRDLQQYRILHFATHGLIYGAYPQLYGVVLSLVDRQGNSQDGFLRLNEIYNLKLAADLVVLSACQTALGKDIRGEGLVGLARGFMYAGAARVLASLWKVDDRASAELMKYFYEGLFGQARLRPSAALRAAQLRMLEQPRWRSPYFWAAFILQGEWK